jgi:KaiC/GvpD/RAD55 family RecA-like ATPase
MGYFNAEKKFTTKGNVVQETKEKVEDILKYSFMEYKERGISKETCERFGVRAGVSELDGKTIDAYYFPSYNQKGKIVGYSKQDITVDKSEKGHWRAIGTVNIGNKLFGQNVSESVSRKRNSLVITEGQLDAMSVYQALTDGVKNTKYSGLEPFVVSIPLGTSNAVESVLHNKDFTKSFGSLCIFFDDDSCTPAEAKKGVLKGHEAREALAGALLDESLPITTVTPDYGFKDANDYLQAGKSTELAKLVQFGKRPFSLEKVIRAEDVSLDEVCSMPPKGTVVDCFPKLMDMLGGFRMRELTMVLAPSGVGKSSCCSLLASKFIQDGHKVGMIFLEESKKDTFQRMIAAELKVNYQKFRRNPLELATREQIEEVRNRIIKNDSLVLLDHFGSLPITDLMSKIKQMVLVENCKYIVLDHISAVISGLHDDNERKTLDVVMTNLASFCSANDVHIIVVSHINRTDSAQFLPQKGKENESFWVNVRKESARGSAALEQFSSNIFALEPEINPDFSRGRVRWKILKTRFGDSLGIADVFTLDQDTWEVVLDGSKF